MTKEEVNPMVEAGSTSGDHPQEEQFRLERDIQLRGAQNPGEYQMPGGLGTLADVQETQAALSRLEGESRTEDFRKHMRESSETGLVKGKDLVITGGGIILDVTKPKDPETPTLSETESEGDQTKVEETDESHLQSTNQSEVDETHSSPDDGVREGAGPGGGEQVGEGTNAPSGGTTSGV